MTSKKQPVTSKSRRRVQNKSVARIKCSPPKAGTTTKKQQLINLLSGAKPVKVEKVSKTLAWQPHTVRAAITGLRKAGFVVENSKGSDDGGTCYRIVNRHQPTSKAA